MVGIRAAINQLCYLHLILEISTSYPIVNLLHQTTCSLENASYFIKQTIKNQSTKLQSKKLTWIFSNDILEDPVKLQ